MNQETRICQNCKQNFVIEPDDFGFYEKFNVPAPLMCPPCRAQRRLIFRNERVFYKRKCDMCGREHVSMYSPNKPDIVYCHDCWFSDKWDPLSYGVEYNSQRPFFEQFQKLWDKVPKLSLIYVRSINSEYTNISGDSKDCYMIVESSNNENCIHSFWLQECKDCVDCSFFHKTELSYESDDCYSCYGLFYSKGCENSRDSYFLLDCRGVSNCIGCVNLRQKSYCIFNKQVSKEEYEKFLKEARLDTYDGVKKIKKQFEEFCATQPRKYAEITQASNCSGNYINNAKNCRYCFHCYEAEDCKYGVHVWRNAKDCMDCDTAGRGAEMIYNSMNCGVNVSHYICSAVCWTCSFMQYSYYCFNSNNCFGSAGLQKKNYCVLNKQYDKESYEKLIGRIIADMRERNEYGEFFPQQLSAFGYNESAAIEQFPLSKEEALAKGFKWEDSERGIFGKETVKWDSVPDSISDFKTADISKEIFACVSCKKNYLVIPREFQFYNRMHIPLPRLCPDCRHERRFKNRGPNRVWKRKCTCAGKTSENGVYLNTIAHSHGDNKCPNEFETPYEPGRPEIVYCESCYNSEVV